MKPPNLTFYGGRWHTTTNFPSSFWTWTESVRIQLQEKSPAFDILRGSKQTPLTLKEPKFILLATFSLPSSSSLKVPNITEREPLECWHYWVATCLSGSFTDYQTDALVNNDNSERREFIVSSCGKAIIERSRSSSLLKNTSDTKA